MELTDLTFSGDAVIAIPARLESKRLPEKVLEDIEGKSMLERVIDNCLKANLPKKVVLCTDNEKIAEVGYRKQIEIFFTDENCSSGSERISSVLSQFISEENFKNTLVINVQGDQPFLDSNVLDLMCLEFFRGDCKKDVLTPIYKLPPHKIHDPNVVKTLVDKNNNALYFSRSALPHIRGVKKEDWYKFYSYWGHVGIYGYKANVLNKWEEMGISKLSDLESLEQLKIIESGYSIGTFEVEGESLSVDTLEHLEEARSIARKLNKI